MSKSDCKQEVVSKNKVNSFKKEVYLPSEGLQGEDIPSHLLWENTNVKSIEIQYQHPLIFKEIFNAASYEEKDGYLVVDKIEWDGYIGLTFSSKKITELEKTIPVKYILNLPNGQAIEVIKKINLFRPQLEIKVPSKKININSSTGFIKGRIDIRNVGRGTLIIQVATKDDSPTKLLTPPEHREFLQKFEADVLQELSNLTEPFPEFAPILEEMQRWDRMDFLELKEQDKKELVDYMNKMTGVLADNKKLLLGFLNAYAKALAKNSELLEAVRRVVTLYDSLVSKNIFLINPFDEITIEGKKATVKLTISQTDKLFDEYEDIQLETIEIESSGEYKLPVYRLFSWSDKK
ncbi:MAG: hypothetical protein IAX21_03765 [Candidatus Bathyarchaeota archaeon]|nr:MAG: hypothetical protein IAX21_03765 [Candidatus Bathyarchaeota archaeon]